MKWKKVNFKEKTISVELTRDYNGARSPKTKNSYGTIEVDDKVIKQLEKYQKWCIEKSYLTGYNLVRMMTLFLSHITGELVGYKYVNDFFDILYNKMKFKDIELKEITPHGLRHTHATILISEGKFPLTLSLNA